MIFNFVDCGYGLISYILFSRTVVRFAGYLENEQHSVIISKFTKALKISIYFSVSDKQRFNVCDCSTLSSTYYCLKTAKTTIMHLIIEQISLNHAQ